jgi:hypothetical protein
MVRFEPATIEQQIFPSLKNLDGLRGQGVLELGVFDEKVNLHIDLSKKQRSTATMALSHFLPETYRISGPSNFIRTYEKQQTAVEIQQVVQGPNPNPNPPLNHQSQHTIQKKR